ncbi:MAG: lamin tail domain-containing protein, partial [Anaerolineae bacterium]|nr:lamin tail domain-containing protein [Anaerolineae bacterium]
NFGTTAVDLTGWILQDEVETKYIFPSFSLPSQATVRVWVKSGTDNATNLYWGRNSATWNNTGDTASLRNAMNIEVDSCTYVGGAPGFVNCE